MRDTLTLPCRPEMVSAARSAVRAALDDHPRVREAELIASELVTNSVRYSASRHGGDIDLIIDWSPGSIRIEVVDGGSDVPLEFPPDPVAPIDPAERGRGLLIVRTLATKWAHETYPQPRRGVWWAELTEEEGIADE